MVSVAVDPTLSYQSFFKQTGLFWRESADKEIAKISSQEWVRQYAKYRVKVSFYTIR